MSRIRIGINGMGRIGRTVLREIIDRQDDRLEVVAVNNPGKPSQYAHLIQYDSLHGKFGHKVSFDDGVLSVGDQKIHFFTQKDPAEISWSDHDVQLVIDATGKFKDGESLGKHLGGSVKKVMMCAPGKDLDGTFVMGINHQDYDSEKHHIVSNASCTTNCLAPVAKVLDQAFGVESGMMTTVHAYTSDQQLLDGSHKDPRRARAAAMSMIPTTTGAAKAVGMVYPALKGKLDGYAVRVPTPNVSLVDLTVSLKKKVGIEEVNKALEEASKGELNGILDYTEEELVSQDYMGLRPSSCVDAKLTNMVEDKIKVVSWYDNEVGFSNRVIDLATYMGERL